MQLKYKLFSGVNCGELWELCGVLSDQLFMDTEECVRDVRGQHLDRSRIMSAALKQSPFVRLPGGTFCPQTVGSLSCFDFICPHHVCLQQKSQQSLFLRAVDKPRVPSLLRQYVHIFTQLIMQTSLAC